MSRNLLAALNADRRGSFSRFLSGYEREPRIAWYPSSGHDFRDLLFLSDAYARRENWSIAAPDIYLHTDYFPWTTSTFLDTPTVWDDGRTAITIRELEELPAIALPLDPDIVDFTSGSRATGRVVYLDLEVRSHQLGVFSAHCVYVFAENEAFCAKKVLPCDGNLSHVIHVRYGGGCGGGGRASGVWVRNILTRVGCEVFVTDDHENVQAGDTAALERYPSLGAHGPEPILSAMRTTPSESWSGHGDVTWYAVGRSSADSET